MFFRNYRIRRKLKKRSLTEVILVRNKEEFLAMFHKGHPVSDFTVDPNVCITLEPRDRFHSTPKIYSLKGVTLSRGVFIRGLTLLKNLDGLTTYPAVALYDLTNLSNMDGVNNSGSITLTSMPYNMAVNPRGLLDSEIKLLKQIPIDLVYMDTWHSDCGTKHCLAGWAQVLDGNEMDDIKAPSVGKKLLPNMSKYFYSASNYAIRNFLKTLHEDK